MEPVSAPVRAAIDPRYTWNATSLFASPEMWEAEVSAIIAGLPAVRAFQGRLAEGPATLADAFAAIQEVQKRTRQVLVYAVMGQAVDTTDQAAAQRLSRARALFGQVSAATAFCDPELLAIGRPTLEQWMAEAPELAYLAHYVHDLFRKQAHVRSAEVEELLGLLNDPFAGSQNTWSALTNADFQFEPARDSDGQPLALTQGTLAKLLASPDREARRTAWEHYTDLYLAHKHALASNLTTSLKQAVFRMRARGHDSVLAMQLFEHAIPLAVFHNLIDTFRRHLPTWHRYWALRRRALGVDPLQPYDVWAPLTAAAPHVSYEQAVDWVCAALEPMGEEYVATVRQGCLQDRWVDVYPNVGKAAGAFSSGAPGAFPFIMMSYNNDPFSMSTLAHELGHSMHSWLSWRHQPVLYGRYSLFAAEVASNFHQAMLRAYLLRTASEREFQIALIEEAMSNFHRYFLVMPTLARFELETHTRVEQGQGLTADSMIELMADLFTEAYGPAMAFDRARMGIQWATYTHLFQDYYVYQYATGISGAHALSSRILAGVPGAAEAYKSFLRAGGSMYPLDALRQAGVDLSSPQPVEEAFGVLAGYVDRLEALLAA